MVFVSFGGAQQMKGDEGYELMNKDNHKWGNISDHSSNIENYSTKSLSLRLLLGALKFFPRSNS